MANFNYYVNLIIAWKLKFAVCPLTIKKCKFHPLHIRNYKQS